MVKEIKGLKCPSHDYARDNYHFMYDLPIGLSLNANTRCMRCGYTMSLHNPQKV